MAVNNDVPRYSRSLHWLFFIVNPLDFLGARIPLWKCYAVLHDLGLGTSRESKKCSTVFCSSTNTYLSNPHASTKSVSSSKSARFRYLCRNRIRLVHVWYAFALLRLPSLMIFRFTNATRDVSIIMALKIWTIWQGKCLKTWRLSVLEESFT